jgi:hypothetical protein
VYVYFLRNLETQIDLIKKERGLHWKTNDFVALHLLKQGILVFLHNPLHLNSTDQCIIYHLDWVTGLFKLFSDNISFIRTTTAITISFSKEEKHGFGFLTVSKSQTSK